MFCGCQNWLDKRRQKCTKLPRNAGEQDSNASSTEYVTFPGHTNWTPGMLRHQSSSDRNVDDELEQSFLKQFLKGHGLYNKHQTIQQRRRLKYLLELEQRAHEGRINVSIEPSGANREMRSIELHSMPFVERNAMLSPKLSCNTIASSELWRGSSLSLVIPVTDTNYHFNGVSTSIPSFTHEAKDMGNSDGLTTIPCVTFASCDALEYAETEV